METLFEILAFLILLFASLILAKSLIWDSGQVSAEREDFYQLKYQFQLFVSIFTIASILFLFTGYQTANDIEKRLSEKLQNKYESRFEVESKRIDSLLVELKSDKKALDNRLKLLRAENEHAINRTEKIDNLYLSLLSQYSSLNESLNEAKSTMNDQKKAIKKSEQKIEKITQTIESIQDIDFLHNVQFIPDLELELTTDKNLWQDTIYFKNLNNSANKALPNFTNPPSVFFTSNQGMSYQLDKVTKDYFVIQALMGEKKDKFLIEALIIAKN